MKATAKNGKLRQQRAANFQQQASNSCKIATANGKKQQFSAESSRITTICSSKSSEIAAARTRIAKFYQQTAKNFKIAAAKNSNF